jgi:RNA polymerase sigma-70 factor (ECF subfamily)
MGAAINGFHQLVDAHYEALFRYAFRLAGSAADAEDLTQEAFGKAFTRLAQLREQERAKAWLFRILRNLYLHKIRDDKRHRVIPLDSVGDLPGRAGSESPEIEPEKLQEALNELEEGFRTPLILFYFEEFSYRDIAEQMDLPIGTVMSRLARAKSYLREKLSPQAESDKSEKNEKCEKGEPGVESPNAVNNGKLEKVIDKTGWKEVSDAVS